MSDFVAKITAELDISKVEQKLNGLNGKKLKLDIDSDSTQKNISGINSSIKTTAKSATYLGDTLKSSLNIGSTAAVVSQGIQLIRTAASNAVEAIKELDSAIVDLRMATGQGYEQTKALVSGYNQMAKDLGSITTQVAASADAWLRQGHSISDTNSLIRDSMILSKVGQLDSAKSTEYLTSAIKGYKVSAEDALSVVDKLTAVDLVSATDAGGLAEGMSEVAVSASNAGVSMDKLLGYLAATGEVTQESMSTIGNTFKTIFARMSDIKTNKLQLIDEDGTVETLSDVETMLSNVGIDLRKTVTEYNDFGSVLDNLAAKWDSLSQLQQNGLAKAFAGTRQQNRFRVLMENYDSAKKYMEASIDSAGTAESKFNAYLDSIEAKTNSLQASFESLAFNSSLTEVYGNILECSTAVLDFLDKTKLLQGALSGLATAGAVEGIKALISGIEKSTTQMSNFNNALTLLSSGSKIMGSDFQSLLAMTDGLTKSQLKAVLSSEALCTEQRIAILTSQGMTTAQAEAALSSMGLATAEGTATGATVTLSSAVKGLWATLAANPLILLVAGVTAGTMAISALSDATKKASEAADELKQTSMEEAQKAREKVQSIEDLILKYKELANSENQDSSTRKEIKSIQSQITDLVGNQADNLDLVNGKLDDQISKLNQIKKDSINDAVNKATTAYHAAKDSHDKAIGQDSAVGLNGYAYVSKDWWQNEDDVIKILQDNGFGNSVKKGGVFNSHTFIQDSVNGDMQALTGATEKAKYLKEMISAIEKNYPDYASSDIWNALSEQVHSYEKYADDMNSTAKSLADAEILSSTFDESLSKMNVNSFENYSEYRNKLIELVKSAPNLSEAINAGDLTNDDIAGQVDSYLATVPKFSDYYSQFSEIEKQKKKIEDVKKAFSGSEWVKKSDTDTATERLKELNDWFDKLSDEDKNIVYSISCNTDTAKFDLNDWQNALESYNGYAKQSAEEIESNVQRTIESTSKLVSGINDVQKTLTSQSTGTSLSVDDFNSDALQDYRSALENVNGTMQLNVDKVNEIIKAKSAEQIKINNTNKALAQSTYLDNAAQIEKLRQKIKDKNYAEGESQKSIQNNIDSLLEENSAIKENCDAYDLMSASLQEATDAYHNWLNEQKASQKGDMFDDTLDAINRINETLNNSDSEYFGRVGRTDYQAALNLIIPDSVNADDKAKVNAYLQSIYDMFTYNDDGERTGLNIEKFCQQAVDKGLMILDESSNSYQIAGQKTMADFAEGLNLSLPLVQAMFGEMEEFGGKFSWADEAVKTIGDLGVAANESAEALRKIKGNETLAIKLDVSEIEGTENKISALESTIKEMQTVKGKANVDASEVEYANQIIEYCIAQQQNLSAPIVMSVDTSAISEKNAEIISQIQEFKRACNDLELKQKIGVDTTDAQNKVNTLAGSLKSIDPKIATELSLDTSSVDKLKASINNITGDQLVKIGIDDSAIVGWTASSKQAKVKYDVDSTAVDNYKKKNDDKTAKVTYHKVTTEIDQYNPSNLSRTVTYHIKTVGSVNSNGVHQLNGTAHLTGTAMATGNWGAKQGGNTLVGELGSEIVVDPHTGRWYTVGDAGAEFVHIPKGAIVFNHKQTESLLANGYVSGRASALVGGTAMVTGGIKRDDAKSSTESGGNSTSNRSRSSDSSSSSSKSSSSKSSSSSSEDQPKDFDWIEIAINRIEKAIDRLKTTATSTYKALNPKLAATYSQITKVNQEIGMQQKAYNRYMQQANSVGLSSSLASKVRDGTIDINKYNSETQELITSYKNWYDKAIACSEAIQKLHESLASLYKDNFDNIEKDFESRLALLEHATKTYNNGISELEELGYVKSKEYYSAMLDIQKQNEQELQNELNDLTNAFSEAMASGEVQAYSETWYDFQNSINGVKEKLQESNTEMITLSKTMRSIDWERFDMVQDRISEITDESDFLIDLMSNSKLHDDKGQMTDEGMATLGLHGSNYNVYMAQADKYAKEISKINQDIANDPYDTKLLDRKKELVELQQQSILNAEKEKQAMIDLAKDGIDAQLSSLKKLIDAYTDSLDKAKDLYDYQKQVNEKTSEISSLKKQINAYAGDDSEENKSRIQKLKNDLKTAEDDLQETEYDKFVDDQKAMLDELYNQYEITLNQRLDNVDALIGDMISTVNDNSSSISDTISTASENVGYTLSDNMQSIWEGSISGVVTEYGDGFNEKLTSINAVLASIQLSVDSLAHKSDEKAKSTTSKTTTTTKPKNNTSNNKPNNNNKKNNNNNQKKKITNGSKINAKGAFIYSDSYGGGKQKQYYSKDPVYVVIGENNGYYKVRHHSLKSGVTGWFKKGDVKAYKTGGLVDYTGLAQLDGTPQSPELVLNSKDTENFIKLRDALRTMAKQPLLIDNVPNIGKTYQNHMAGFFDSIDIKSKLSDLSNPTFTTNVTIGDINIPIERVNDYNDFVNQLKKDDKFANMIRSETIDLVRGGSKLAKNKYTWK